MCLKPVVNGWAMVANSAAGNGRSCLPGSCSTIRLCSGWALITRQTETLEKTTRPITVLTVRRCGDGTVTEVRAATFKTVARAAARKTAATRPGRLMDALITVHAAPCRSGSCEMLSTLMLDAIEVWNHNAFFDFVDRWMTGSLSDANGSQNKFVTYMWNTYRHNLPVPTSAIPIVPEIAKPQAEPRAIKITPDRLDINPGFCLYDIYGRKAIRLRDAGVS